METEFVSLVGTGDKATLITETQVMTPADPNQTPAVNRIQVPEQLPVILAGPILRTVTTSSVTIWLATSIDVHVRFRVVSMADQSVLSIAESNALRLGDKLYIHITHLTGSFPRNQLLGYNAEILLKRNEGVTAFEGEVLLHPDEVAIGGLTLPTFFIPEQNAGRNFLHASCRKLHGPGRDASDTMETLLAGVAEDLSQRPSNLFLTGDQIYADDVDANVLVSVSRLGRTLLGWDEAVPTLTRRTADLKPGSRTVVRTIGFSVEEGDCPNHLLGFGEFAAMYILAWNPEIWEWPRLRELYGFPLRRKPIGIRRLLANIPCYMQFDDHEVTDDWNLSALWKRETNNDAARLIIANGLAAFWAFQASGNPLQGRDAALRTAIQSYTSGRGADPGPFTTAMLGFHDWHFTAPTEPAVIILDTRTQREFVSIPATGIPSARLNPPAALMNSAAFAQFRAAIAATGAQPEEPLVIVSPAPYIGYEKIEKLQRDVADIGESNDPLDAEQDPEAWGFHLDSFIEFLRVIAESGRTRVVILSGDVHYAFTAAAALAYRRNLETAPAHVAIVQCTASALKNHPGVSINLLEEDSNQYHRVLYPGDPVSQWADGDHYRYLLRLGMTNNWEIQWRWLYRRMGSNSIIHDNNFGQITFDRTSIRHSVITHGERTATAMNWDDIRGLLPGIIGAAAGAR